MKTGAADKIRALYDRYPKMTKAAIARRVGCDWSNVDQVLRRYLGSRPIEQLRAFQEHKADILDSVAMRSVESITDAKLAKASPLALATVVGILHDKSALLRGQATGINVTVLMDVVEAIRARQH